MNTTPAKVQRILDRAARRGLTVVAKPHDSDGVLERHEIHTWEVRNPKRSWEDVVWLYWSPGRNGGRLSLVRYRPMAKGSRRTKNITRAEASHIFAGMAEYTDNGLPVWLPGATYTPES